MALVKQKLTVRSADRVKFMDAIVELAAKGAVRPYNAVPHMVCPFWVEMEIEVDRASPMTSTPVIIAHPIAAETFTRQELETMVWEEFREAVRQLGVKGRDRTKMLEEYLDKVRNMV